jgi:branched-chain amino acid transport system permease protein
MSAVPRISLAAWGYAAFAAILIGVPLLAPQFWVTLGNYIGLYSIVALGLVLLTGVAGQTSFGQAAFVGIGAYTTAILATRYGWSPWANLAVGLMLTLSLALCLGFITLRMKGHYLPLATIAWGTSIYFLMGNLEFLGGHTGLTGVPALDLFGFELKDERYYYFLIWGIAIVASGPLRTCSIRGLGGRSGRCARNWTWRKPSASTARGSRSWCSSMQRSSRAYPVGSTHTCSAS